MPGVDLSAVASVLGISTTHANLRAGAVLFLPQRIALFGQGASAAVYSLEKRQITSAPEAGAIYGFGSPVHLDAMQLLPANGDGAGTTPVTVYPLEDAVGAVAAAGEIAPVGVQTEAAAYRVLINEIRSEPFVVSAGDAIADICTAMAAAINSILEMPVTAVATATGVDLTAKWAGESSNAIYAEVVGEDRGVTFAVTQPSGGLVNPNVDVSLALMGEVWETLVLNALNVDDTDTLERFRLAGEGRWGALFRRPFVCFTGTTEADVTAATAVPDARRTDRINAQLVAPGSKELPSVVAARQLARIARVANDNPPVGYTAERATGLVPGADADQWDYTQRDLAVKAGSSTIEVKDGEVSIGDVVTFYHPTGDTQPAYRYVVDIMKVMNILFNIDLIFAAKEWAAAPLIPNGQPTVNPKARKPSAAVAAVCAKLDSLGLHAILSDPETAKSRTFASVSASNPRRLDVSTTVQIAGNTKIVSVDLSWGFYYGAPAVVG